MQQIKMQTKFQIFFRNGFYSSVFIIFIGYLVAIVGEDKELTPEKLLEIFPICDLDSSPGQHCQSFGIHAGKATLTNICCDQNIRIEFTQTAAFVTQPGQWEYTIAREKILGGAYIISFEDKSIGGGTYHNLIEYWARYSNGKLFLYRKSEQLVG